MPSLTRTSQLDPLAFNMPAQLWRLLPPTLVYVLTLALYLLVGDGPLVRLMWLAGMALAAWTYFDRDVLPRLNREDGRDIVILAGILIAAFAMRFWRLAEIPDYIHGDIGSQGLQAIDILNKGGHNWFSVGWSDIPMMDYVMMAGTMRLFGTDLFGLSMTAVWQGMLTVAGMYLLGREMFNRQVGLLAAAILTISYTHIHFSRFVTTAAPVMFLVFTLYFLFRGLRLRHGFWCVLGGISLALGIMVYFAGRVVVVIVLALLVLRLIQNRKAFSEELGLWFAFGLGALIGFGPMMGFVLQDFRAYVGRGNVVTLANPDVMNHLMGKYGADSPTQVWIENIKRTFLTFFRYGDASTHFSYQGPIVGPLTAVLMVLGLGFSVRRLLEPRFFTLIVWFMATLILGSVITNDPPFWAHIAIVLPAVALLAAVAADRIWAALVSIVPDKYKKTAYAAIGAVLAAAILISGVRNWQAYTDHVGNNADSIVTMARYAGSFPSDTRVVFVEDPLGWKRREFQFFANHLNGIGINASQIASFIEPDPAIPTVFLLTTNHADLLPKLQARFPASEVEQIFDSRGGLALHSVAVQPPGYKPPPDQYIPSESIRTRSLAGWLVGGLLLAIVLSAGVYVALNRPPAVLEPKPTSPETAEDTPIPIAKGGASAAAPASATAEAVEDSKAEIEPIALTSAASVAAAVAAQPQAERYERSRLLASLAGMTVALILAYLAQRFFDGQGSGLLMETLIERFALDWSVGSRLNLGTMLNLAAMILFAITALPLKKWTTRQVRFWPERKRNTYTPGPYRPDARIYRHGQEETAPNPIEQPSRPTTEIDVRVHWGVLTATLIPYLLAMIRFARQGEDPLVRWLWAASMTIFILGMVLWPFLRRTVGEDAQYSPRFNWKVAMILGLILVGGFWLRFNNVAHIPSDVHGDMASHGLQAREILTGANPYLFREGWANIPMMAFVPASLSLRIFGNDLFGLQMTSVIGGFLSLLALYLLTWRSFDSHRLAALATAILAINTPHIHFSRIAEYMDPWPFLLFGMFFLVDGLRAKRNASFAAAGVLIGLGMQMYFSGRVSAVFLIIAFLYLLLFQRRLITSNISGIALLLLGSFIAVGPSLIYFAENYEAFVERSRSVFLFYPPVLEHLSGKYGSGSTLDVMLEQGKRSLLMFNYSIDTSTQFGYPHPMFNSLLSPLVVFGFGYSVRWWRRPQAALILIWLLSILVVGSVLTNNAPFWPRLVGILPAAALLAALVIDRLWEAIWHLADRRRTANIVLLLASAALLIYAGWQNWTLYYKTVENNARPQARIGRYLASLPPEIAACGFLSPYELGVRETRFQAWPGSVMDIPADAPDTLLATCPGPPLVWILAPVHTEWLGKLQGLWPDGMIEEHHDHNNALAFVSYLVTAGTFLPTVDLPPPVREQEQEIPQPFDSAVKPPLTEEGFTPYLPDGSAFKPEEEFYGNTASTVFEIPAGSITVNGGEARLLIGPIPGYGIAYDYVELRGKDGSVIRIEAEDTGTTTGDEFAEREGDDGHWWLQNYGRFSGSQGLIAHRGEMVPVLITAISVPDGDYDVHIGSFTGDADNGVFALGIRWE